MLSLIITSITTAISAAIPEQPRDLPAHFVADRVFIEPSLANGETLRLFTDTGGGANMLCRGAAASLDVDLAPFSDPEIERELGGNLARTEFPLVLEGAGVPAAATGDTRLLVHDCDAGDHRDDGLLSSRWFDGRIWTWDYPNGKLRLESANFQSGETARPVELGFKSDKSGKRLFAMPRLVVTIDSQPLDMLLDTGATTSLTSMALAKIDDALPPVRATSLIVHSRLEAWHKRHPNWRIITDAESGTHARMIEVPAIRIAEFEVGPIWFTERPDANFHQWLAQMMDKPTDGAIGGNAFAHFVMTVDYPDAVAYFRCTKDCQPIPPPVP